MDIVSYKYISIINPNTITMLNLLLIFIAVAELVNLGVHIYRKDQQPVNFWQVIIVLFLVGICRALGCANVLGGYFLGFLFLYYLIGLGMEKHGNPFNFNILSGVLLGAYMMGAALIIIINYPCSEIGDCMWHDYLFQLQGMCR